MPQHAVPFARQIDAGRLAESVCRDVLIEFRRAEPQSDLDRADVARLGQNLRNRQIAVGFVIANAMPRDVDHAVLAIHHVVGPRQTLIDRRGQRYNLKDRSRLIERANGAIHARFRRTRAGRIRIERRKIRNRQQFSSARIFHDHGAGDGMRLLNRRVQLALGDVLNVLIQRQNDAARGRRRLIAAVHRMPVRVG